MPGRRQGQDGPVNARVGRTEFLAFLRDPSCPRVERHPQRFGLTVSRGGRTSKPYVRIWEIRYIDPRDYNKISYLEDLILRP
jgi:hypothetical protein